MQRGANLHQLEARFDLLDEDVGLDRAAREAEVQLERRQDLVPQRGFGGGLDLRQVEDERRADAAHPLLVVDDVERDVGDGGREARAVVVLDVAVVEVEAARPEDARREVELLPPVDDRSAAEEVSGPGVHLLRDLLRRGEEHRVTVIRQLEVALVVERHRRDLPERVLAVEHPAVRSRQERVGDVADALVDRRVRLRRRAGALDPLTLQVAGNLGPFELRRSRIPHGDRRSRDPIIGSQEVDAGARSRPLGAPRDPRVHQRLAFAVEARPAPSAPRVRPACKRRCTALSDFHESSTAEAP